MRLRLFHLECEKSFGLRLLRCIVHQDFSGQLLTSEEDGKNAG